ncbi:plasmid partitioning protein RepB [Sulfitobacter sp. F26169L]|uniref:plasmid partitioning protein RepB n=1 Tax=Sulfitobacter sp. F26169L TaxID=2996015 RepID=UPI002260A2E9|nr:plasmid partitioning protein RepB [Sulfitobacter sp. F26169L]MCX7567406.1 plasmid partitioning protein RepB [Sulfitobacter sp. F26169L]
MARKGILSSEISKPDRTRATPPAPSRGAVGALQSSLTKLQENAVQEIDANLIDDAGIEDRLGLDPAAQQQLVESLKTYGQQVPVLLRPNTSKPGRYEIVYGRRRLKALKSLGQPVKAMIRQLDDHALVMAQGQENTARQDLSFIEKASFAAQLHSMEYDRQTIAAALSIDLPMLSRMLKVGTAFPLPFLRDIGSAPSIGRDRWMALARALEQEGVRARVSAFMQGPDFIKGDSDARFEAVFARATTAPETRKAPPAKPRTLRSTSGKAVADIRANAKGVTLNIPARTAEGFDVWVNSNAEALLGELHDRWEKERSEDT